jgi:hypothetical protein
MNISFTCGGLEFHAKVKYTPGDPGRLSGPPEHCYPPEAAEMEFSTLTCNGKDARFLMDSDWCNDIYEQAEIAAAETHADRLEEARAERYERYREEQ